jgi:endonuclease YncB( thermonuclease family)
MYEYRVQVLRVVDGDTLYVEVDFGLDSSRKIELRLEGLDAPERETPAGKQVKQWLTERLRPLPYVIVRTIKDRREKYGRYRALLIDPLTGAVINDEMIATGLAKVYTGGAR